MSQTGANHFLVVGAGVAGLMAARELARAGNRITILEARDRCGGRIYPLSSERFGYPAEGGAEFVHGAAPLTRALIREAGLSYEPRTGARWSMASGVCSPAGRFVPLAERFYRALATLKDDLPIAEFLETHFADPRHASLRRAITRMVEGYDLADPRHASTLAIRDEWQAREGRQNGRIAEGYGALVEHLAAACRDHGVAIQFGAAVAAIDEHRGRIAARSRNGAVVEGDAAILTVPRPILAEIALPSAERRRVAAARDIGFGNVVKILLRFATTWWADRGVHDLSFLRTDTVVPTWWTQYPAAHPVLTGWCPTLRIGQTSSLSEAAFVDIGLVSLSETFGLPMEKLRDSLVASQAINWANDPFARGAYSYATPRTRGAQALLSEPGGGAIFYAGEAFDTGPDMGTVEAALASGKHVARTILAAER